MKVNSNVKPIVFLGEDSARLVIQYTNMGDPFRHGAYFTMESELDYVNVFLEERELKELRDFLNDYFKAK